MDSRFLRLLLACGLMLFACAGPQMAQPGPAVLTQAQIIDLSRQGVAPAQIIEGIERSQAVYLLSAADVARLQAAGVSNEVIDHMMATYHRAACAPRGRRLWYRQGQFYAPPPFSAHQGAYRF